MPWFRSDDVEYRTLGNGKTRAPGVFAFGPWIIEGGCDTREHFYYAIQHHKPWHGLWTLDTIVGPFRLPKASDRQQPAS